MMRRPRIGPSAITALLGAAAVLSFGWSAQDRLHARAARYRCATVAEAALGATRAQLHRGDSYLRGSLDRTADAATSAAPAGTRHVVMLLVARWAARPDLRASFSTNGSPDVPALVGWARRGFDSDAIAISACESELDRFPGAPDTANVVGPLLRWARRQQPPGAELDDAAFSVATALRAEPTQLARSRSDPRSAFVWASRADPRLFGRYADVITALLAHSTPIRS